MGKQKSKSSLSEPGGRLVELMQRLNFGRIEDLVVRDGEPVLSPAPTVIRKVKIGAENGPRAELSHADFLLKEQMVELFDAIAALGEGKVRIIEVRYGLPFAVEIEVAGDLHTAAKVARRG